jgi:hypothetical protein
MLIKGYSFSEIYNNGQHNFDEKALKYDGQDLQLLRNDNGLIEYKSLSNEELMKYIGSHKKPLMERLQNLSSKKITRTKRHKTRKSKSKSRSISKSRSGTISRSKSKTRSKSKSKRKHKSKSKRETRRIERPLITPDILKTIY